MSNQSRSVVDRVAELGRIFPITRWTSGGERTDGDHADPGEGTDATDERTGPRERGETGKEGRATVTPATLAEVDPDELETKADVQMQLGLTPTEFVMQLLNAHDGELEQQAFTDYTDWSPSTVSRVLQELEEDGRIVRVRIGRSKTVYHPDRAPSQASDPRVDGDDGPVASDGMSESSHG